MQGKQKTLVSWIAAVALVVSSTFIPVFASISAAVLVMFLGWLRPVFICAIALLILAIVVGAGSPSEVEPLAEGSLLVLTGVGLGLLGQKRARA